MSNRIKKITKNIIERQRYEAFLMENSIAGTALLTVAKLAGVKESKCFAVFQEAEKQNFNNIKEMVDYFIKVLPIKESYKNDIVLVYDENNVMAPAVTVCISSSEGNVMFLPVGENGYTPAVLRHLNDENITVEYIYKDEDEEQGD
jgi:hypothetical protein